MKQRSLLLSLIVSLGVAHASASVAQAPQLHYQTGTIPLLGGKASLNTGNNLRFLAPEEAQQVIVDLWGNPPQSAEGVLGMIVPAGVGPDERDGWAVVITETKDGHISDKDAKGLNYDKIMQQLQADTASENEERQKAGYESVELVGWADTPSYDALTHKMYWAQNVKFQGNTENTLNYAVRVLGRDNVMELNAVASMSQLPQVKQGMQAVLQQATFNSPFRYEDYNPKTDQLATYGVAGLLGVAAAKKVGLLGLLAVFLKKGWILLAAAFGGLGRFFKRNA